MNGVLLTALLLFCGYDGPKPDAGCMKRQLSCVAEGKAYEMGEAPATTVASVCMKKDLGTAGRSKGGGPRD